jgi:ribosomal protein L32
MERRTVRQSKDGGKPKNREPQVKTCKNCGAVLLRDKGCACYTTPAVEETLDDMDTPLVDWRAL